MCKISHILSTPSEWWKMQREKNFGWKVKNIWIFFLKIHLNKENLCEILHIFLFLNDPFPNVSQPLPFLGCYCSQFCLHLPPLGWAQRIYFLWEQFQAWLQSWLSFLCFGKFSLAAWPNKKWKLRMYLNSPKYGKTNKIPTIFTIVVNRKKQM